jgi:hypothetical protein
MTFFLDSVFSPCSSLVGHPDNQGIEQFLQVRLLLQRPLYVQRAVTFGNG